jgi:ABC-type enterochelin transport system permease subunit
LVPGVLGVLALLVLSLLTGVYDVFGAQDGREMFAITRVPRTIALVLAGAAMSMCGLVMQLLTQNRFVEPTTTGTTEWAGLGLIAAFIVLPAPTLVWRMVFAVVFAFVGTMVFFAFLRRVTLRSSLIVPIIGIMLGAVVGSVSSASDASASAAFASSPVGAVAATSRAAWEMADGVGSPMRWASPPRGVVPMSRRVRSGSSPSARRTSSTW